MDETGSASMPLTVERCRSPHNSTRAGHVLWYTIPEFRPDSYDGAVPRVSRMSNGRRT